MKCHPLPSYEELHSLFEYNECNGTLHWKYRDDVRKSWNTKFVGKECGTTVRGRVTLRINTKPYLAHRIIWKMLKGDDPLYIDHIDGNPSNNRLSNLRSVTLEQNQKNRRPTKNNKGVFGLHRSKHSSWVIQIKEGYFGSHKCLGQAIKIRNSLYDKYGYHENHGKIITI